VEGGSEDDCVGGSEALLLLTSTATRNVEAAAAGATAIGELTTVQIMPRTVGIKVWECGSSCHASRGCDVS
jgi:hypothetical protein